jgi:hypothetical protein
VLHGESPKNEEEERASDFLNVCELTVELTYHRGPMQVAASDFLEDNRAAIRL